MRYKSTRRTCRSPFRHPCPCYMYSIVTPFPSSPWIPPPVHTHHDRHHPFILHGQSTGPIGPSRRHQALATVTLRAVANVRSAPIDGGNPDGDGVAFDLPGRCSFPRGPASILDLTKSPAPAERSATHRHRPGYFPAIDGEAEPRCGGIGRATCGEDGGRSRFNRYGILATPFLFFFFFFFD